MINRRQFMMSGAATGALLAAPLAVPLGLTAPLGLADASASTFSRRATPVGAVGLNIAYAGNAITNLPYLEQITGCSYNAVHVYCDAAGTWSDFTGPEMFFIQEAGNRFDQWVTAVPGRKILISPGMIPSTVASQTPTWCAQGAAGAYNQYWAAWGTRLVAAGLGSAMVRVAHECNGPWMRYYVGNTAAEQATWAAYFRQIAGTLRGVSGSSFSIEWNVNGGYDRLNPSGYYPGDRHLDIIGIDQYDSTIDAYSGTPGGQWAIQLNGQGLTGLGTIMQFATTHRKPMAFSEWGLTPAGTNGYGDDAAYVSNMADIFAGTSPPGWTGSLPVVAYQSLFNPLAVTPGNPPTVTNASSDPEPIQNAPNSLAAYKHLFG